MHVVYGLVGTGSKNSKFEDLSRVRIFHKPIQKELPMNLRNMFREI